MHSTAGQGKAREESSRKQRGQGSRKQRGRGCMRAIESGLCCEVKPVFPVCAGGDGEGGSRPCLQSNQRHGKERSEPILLLQLETPLLRTPPLWSVTPPRVLYSLSFNGGSTMSFIWRPYCVFYLEAPLCPLFGGLTVSFIQRPQCVLYLEASLCPLFGGSPRSQTFAEMATGLDGSCFCKNVLTLAFARHYTRS